MSILDRIFGKNHAIPSTAVFRITEEGRDKLQEFNGDTRSQVLMALETKGSSTINEIANVGHLNRGSVERSIPALINQHYVQYVNATSSGEE